MIYRLPPPSPYNPPPPWAIAFVFALLGVIVGCMIIMSIK